MYCWKCGTRNEEGSLCCAQCGEEIRLPAREVSSAEDIGQDAGIRLLIPVGRSGWAIAAGYVGLVSLLLWPAGPIAVALSIVAIVDIKRNPKKHGMGRAVFGLVVGGIATLLLAFVVGSAVL